MLSRKSRASLTAVLGANPSWRSRRSRAFSASGFWRRGLIAQGRVP